MEEQGVKSDLIPRWEQVMYQFNLCLTGSLGAISFCSSSTYSMSFLIWLFVQQYSLFWAHFLTFCGHLLFWVWQVTLSQAQQDTYSSRIIASVLDRITVALLSMTISVLGPMARTSSNGPGSFHGGIDHVSGDGVVRALRPPCSPTVSDAPKMACFTVN